MTRVKKIRLSRPAVAIETGHGGCAGLDGRVTRDALVVSKMVMQYRRVDFAMAAQICQIRGRCYTLVCF